MKRYLLGFLIALAFVFAACSSDDDNAPGPTVTIPSASLNNTVPPVATYKLSGTLTVFAASSLTEAFAEIGQKFETKYPDVYVEFNFAGTSSLITQLQQGVSADVLAGADGLTAATKAGAIQDDSQIFAWNRLVVIVPKANSAGVTTLHDLARPGVKVVLADATVPVGKYARQFLDKATGYSGTPSASPAFSADYTDKVLANVITNASNVKQVASIVQLDEADAGIVYKTDVTAEFAQEVTTIEIPDDLNVIAMYPIAVTTQAAGTAQNQTAQVFIKYVMSPEGQAVLATYGFMKASGQ